MPNVPRHGYHRQAPGAARTRGYDMIEVWLIIFTSMAPNVEPRLQELVSPNCRQELTRTIQAMERAGITVTARCENRKRPIKEELK